MRDSHHSGWVGGTDWCQEVQAEQRTNQNTKRIWPLVSLISHHLLDFQTECREIHTLLGEHQRAVMVPAILGTPTPRSGRDFRR